MLHWCLCGVGLSVCRTAWVNRVVREQVRCALRTLGKQMEKRPVVEMMMQQQVGERTRQLLYEMRAEDYHVCDLDAVRHAWSQVRKAHLLVSLQQC